MRYAPKAGLHPILGKFVEVRDLKNGGVVTLFTGERAWDRAEARCAAMNGEGLEHAEDARIRR